MRFSSAFCNAVLRMLWLCYRHGIQDACACGDEGACDEALEELWPIDSFGTLERYGFEDADWSEWQFKVLRWTRDDICRARTADLLMALRSPAHPLAFILSLAKAFYCRGMKDWMECREWLTPAVAALMPNYPYLLKRARYFRQSKLSERFELLQTESYGLIKLIREQGYVDSPLVVPASRVRTFTERVWSALQKRRWFDDYDADADAWDDLDPLGGIDIGEVTGSDLYTEEDKGDEDRIKQKRAYRRVPRKDEGGRDAPADGAVLQQGAPKRRRGRPPKNV